MIHKYLEIQWGKGGELFIWDNSLYIECIEHNGNYRLMSEYRAGYITISGKNTTYHVKGLESVEKAQQFAIWYHVNKSGGRIETCCENCITSRPEPKQPKRRNKRSRRLD